MNRVLGMLLVVQSSGLFAQTSRYVKDEYGKHQAAVMELQTIIMWEVLLCAVIGSVLGFLLAASPRINMSRLQSMFYGALGAIAVGIVSSLLYGHVLYSAELIQKSFVVAGSGAVVGSVCLPLLITFFKGK